MFSIESIKEFVKKAVFPGQESITETMSELDRAKEEYKMALDGLNHARKNLNEAGQDYFEIANEELNLAINKYQYALANVKKLTNSKSSLSVEMV